MKFSVLKACTILVVLVSGIGCAPTKYPEPRFDVAPKNSEPRFDITSKDNVMPITVYPAESRRLREQGQVQVNIYVLSNGSVGDARIFKSSGFERLDQAALDWYRHHGKYLPAVKDGQAIDAWKVITVNFSLPSEPKNQ